MRVDILGVKVDVINKKEALEKIEGLIKTGGRYLVTTPYSEMIVLAQKDLKYREVLNQASLSLPDGMGILAAADFLSAPSLKSPLRLPFLVLRGLFTGFKVMLARSRLSPVKETVSGSDIFWDLVDLVNSQGHKLFLLGGRSRISGRLTNLIVRQYPTINIKHSSGVSNKDKVDLKEDETIVKQINDFDPDVLLVAYGPPYQEKWLVDNMNRLNFKVGMGMGGTFDMIVGRLPKAPNPFRLLALEWLWRLILEPSRLKRIYHAVVVFPWLVFTFKLKSQG